MRGNYRLRNGLRGFRKQRIFVCLFSILLRLAVPCAMAIEDRHLSISETFGNLWVRTVIPAKDSIDEKLQDYRESKREKDRRQIQRNQEWRKRAEFLQENQRAIPTTESSIESSWQLPAPRIASHPPQMVSWNKIVAGSLLVYFLHEGLDRYDLLYNGEKIQDRLQGIWKYRVLPFLHKMSGKLHELRIHDRLDPTVFRMAVTASSSRAAFLIGTMVGMAIGSNICHWIGRFWKPVGLFFLQDARRILEQRVRGDMDRKDVVSCKLASCRRFLGLCVFRNSRRARMAPLYSLGITSGSTETTSFGQFEKRIQSYYENRAIAYHESYESIPTLDSFIWKRKVRQGFMVGATIGITLLRITTT